MDPESSKWRDELGWRTLWRVRTFALGSDSLDSAGVLRSEAVANGEPERRADDREEQFLETDNDDSLCPPELPPGNTGMSPISGIRALAPWGNAPLVRDFVPTRPAQGGEPSF